MEGGETTLARALREADERRDAVLAERRRIEQMPDRGEERVIRPCPGLDFFD